MYYVAFSIFLPFSSDDKTIPNDENDENISVETTSDGVVWSGEI